MAELPYDPQVIDLIENTRGLLGKPMNQDGSRMTKLGELALCYLHQVRVRSEHDDGGKMDPQITFELIEAERVSENQLPEALDKSFLLFGKEGQMQIKGAGTVKCRTMSGHLLWPDTYRLLPTLPEECWKDPSKAKDRLAEVLDMRKRVNPRKRIETHWRSIQQALHSNEPKLLRRNPHGHYGATFYQRDGDALWIGRPPCNFFFDEKDRSIIKMRPEDNAVCVCLSTEFVSNLELYINEVTLKRMAFLEEADWGRR